LENKTDKQNTWLVVVNPTSGGGKIFRRFAEIEKAFAAYGIIYDVRFTKKAGDATEIVKNGLLREGYRRIMGIGGDGTGNEIINGIFGQRGVPIEDIVYTLYGGGTGNDWVKMYDMPSDFSAFCAMILRGCTTQQDIGMVQYLDARGVEQEKYFANAGGLGYDSFVVQSVEAGSYGVFPKKFAYFMHILKCLFSYKAEPLRAVFDGETVEDKFYSIHFGINKYAGAGMQLTPHAVKDDGLLALTMIRDIPYWKVLLYLAKLYSGSVAKIPEARVFKTSEIKFESLGQPIFCEADGELIGQTPTVISILEKRLNIVAPQP
jgi:YegS/Rv2252/BmrU family lipid kinase